MKKIIGIAIASLMFFNIAFAEMTLIEQKTIKGPKTWKDTYNLHATTVCIDRYKFVLNRESSMIQFFEERDGKSLPAKCS